MNRGQPANRGLLERIWLRIRWVFYRLLRRDSKKNPNIYPLY